MKLKRFKETDKKKIGVFIFTIVCVLLVSGVVLYRTFAVFEVRTNQNVIKGTVQDPGNIYFAFYQKNEETGNYEIQKDMPDKNSGYVLDEEASYCGVNGEKDTNIKVSLTENWNIVVHGITTSRTKCNLYFTKGIFLMGHGVPIVTSGTGLYEVKHETITGTTNDDAFNQTEYRYAGRNPNNYVNFNGELWRIIGLVNVITNDNQPSQRIKLKRAIRLDSYSWNTNQPDGGSSTSTSGSNDWSEAKLQKLLNDTYYNSSTGKCPMGAGTESECSFEETGLKNSQEFIDKVTWNIGGIDNMAKNTNAAYILERGTSTTSNHSNIWEGKVGLIYPSDYGYAVGGNVRNKCLNTELSSWSQDDCGMNNWIFDYTVMHTITPSSLNSTYVYVINLTQLKTITTGEQVYSVFPTLYLKPTVKIISGTGTSDDAFQLAQVIKN